MGARGLVVQFGRCFVRWWKNFLVSNRKTAKTGWGVRCIVRWRKNLLVFNRKTAKTGWESGVLYVGRKTCFILTRKCRSFVSKCKFFYTYKQNNQKTANFSLFWVSFNRKILYTNNLKKRNTNLRKIQKISLHILILVFKSIHHSQINISMLQTN